MPFCVGQRLGPYEVLAPLGAGGMGEVYRARDTRLSRDVAVKVLPMEFSSDPERLRRFEQEARATAALDHPNILAVFDIGTHEGTPYIVEQLLEGENLRQRLRGGPLPPAKAVEFGIQIAQGLATAHEKGIVHRDLKPENLFITKEGRIKILDFGLARLRPQEGAGPQEFSEAPTADQPTRKGAVLGTSGYMSPEQVRGQTADARTDIFAFGAVLYEMLAGRRAFGGGTAADTQAAILTKDPEPLPAVTPRSLDRVVRRCVEKRVEDRFLTAHELLLALEMACTSSAPMAAFSGARGWPKRYWSLSGAVVLLLAAVLAGILLWHPWRGNPSPSTPAATSVPSLVALPCKVLGSPESEYLTDAIPSTISTLLGEVQGLDTKVPPTSIEVEKVNGDMDKIAAAYGVRSFVLSTATAEGDHFVVNVQVADAGTRKIRWSHTYEATKSSFSTMAREAAQGISKALLPEVAVAIPATGTTANSEADLAVKEGLFYSMRYGAHGDRADFDRSLKAYQRALELDPRNAKAAALIGGLYDGGVEHGKIPRAQGLAAAKEWTRKALDLDPTCGEAWWVKGLVETYNPDAKPEDQFEWSLKYALYAPRDGGAHGALAQGLLFAGSGLLCLEAQREGVKLDPLSWGGYYCLTFFLAYVGRPAEAVEAADQGLSLEPGSRPVLEGKAYALVEMRRPKEASAILKDLETSVAKGGVHEQFVQDFRWDLALTAGDDREARSALKEIVGHFADASCPWGLLQVDVCILLPAVSQRFGTNAALDLLTLSTNRGATYPYDILMLRPDFKELREDPRAKEVIAKNKAPFAMMIRILQDARAKGELPKYLEKPMDDLLKELSSKGAWP